MKVINASTIGHLITAHYEYDEEKFLTYANFIADAYKESGDFLGERIIRKRIDGTYNKEPVVTLDNGSIDKPKSASHLLPEVQEEFNCFLNDMKSGLAFGRYLDEDAYEDEYSNNDIKKMQSQLLTEIRKWLLENKPGEYLANNSYCVFVMTPEEAEKRNVTKYEEYVVR